MKDKARQCIILALKNGYYIHETRSLMLPDFTETIQYSMEDIILSKEFFEQLKEDNVITFYCSQGRTNVYGLKM